MEGLYFVPAFACLFLSFLLVITVLSCRRFSVSSKFYFYYRLWRSGGGINWPWKSRKKAIGKSRRGWVVDPMMFVGEETN